MSGVAVRHVIVWCGLVWAAACVKPEAVTCSDGLVCPPGNVCDTVHGGCASQEQIRPCAAQPDLAPCTYPGVDDGACFDGVCLPAGCGNGTVNDPEVCDDGNRLHGDECSADCLSNETCGNGVIDAVNEEACDDGNTLSGDGCQATCIQPQCGDGVVDADLQEECDDGTANAELSDACRPTCRLPSCGDGVIDSGEVCDQLGNHISGDGCSFDCKSLETCGNNYIDYAAGEVCEDDAQDHDGCSLCQFEEPAWTQLTPGTPGVLKNYAMTYDSARGRVVLFGGDNGSTFNNLTWEWDGASWANVTPPSGNPSIRRNHGMAYDAARRRVVMFGGFAGGGAILGDTWEWNGAVWTNVSPPATNPAIRERHAMAYDAARRRVVMFGGANLTTNFLGDTWEWNGTMWTNVTPASGGPDGRRQHAMAYDAKRSRVVMFSGTTSTASPADTWEWNGTAWADVTPASGNPSARVEHSMAYDTSRSRVIMVGDSIGGEIWEWSGTAWADVTPASGNPSARTDLGLAYDSLRGRGVIYGGNAGATIGDTWEWNGTAWSDRTPAAVSLSARTTQGSLTYDSDRGRVIMFSGASETWEWDGAAWTRIPTAVSPPARTEYAIAYDVERKQVVLFGGFLASATNETWVYSGTTWTNVTPVSGNPPARNSHGLAYDAARKRVVLFGGTTGSTLLNDTWEWNGSAWANLTPASGNPIIRSRHALVYDPVRARVVLFGGVGSGAAIGTLNDTWEWNGTTWMNKTPAAGSPGVRSDHALAFDLTRGSVILFGGSIGVGRLDETWEWNGTTWTDRTRAGRTPPARSRHGMAYDTARRSILLFGGSGAGSPLGDTWQFRYARAESPAERCLFGTDGDDDGLVGCADPDCFGACSALCNPTLPTLMACAPTWPRCGDGTCQGVETKRLCPGDCGTQPVVCGDYLCESPETAVTCPGDCP